MQGIFRFMDEGVSRCMKGGSMFLSNVELDFETTRFFAVVADVVNPRSSGQYPNAEINMRHTYAFEMQVGKMPTSAGSGPDGIA